jgi:hypothetical protein
MYFLHFVKASGGATHTVFSCHDRLLGLLMVHKDISNILCLFVLVALYNVHSVIAPPVPIVVVVDLSIRACSSERISFVYSYIDIFPPLHSFMSSL